MSTSLEDVARSAGVSPSTVSRALRGLPGVNEDNRRRIAEIAASLGYVISPAASRLASGRMHTIGVVVPYVNRWFFGQVILGVESVLRARGFDLLLYNIGDNAGRERFFVEMPLRRRVDGVIVLSLPLSKSEVDRLTELNVPVAVVGVAATPFACVRIDDVSGAITAVRHLTQLGHRDIGLISSGTEIPMNFTTPVERRNGYLTALNEAHIDYDASLEAIGGFTIASGERAMARLLRGVRRPTAVFAESDEMAFGALRAIRRAGLRVPVDISVVGFDNHDMADLLDLTTIEQPVVQQGETVAQMLLDLLAAGGEPSGQLEVLPTRLLVRGSTAPRAHADALPAHYST
ncbi:LacI family DNA-binding transcriptional regulator [Micromonospora sp. KC721]|uniref:LacI family DNA-binding transcriptional regulator n=1 Tax=Micromonospora sp. KC721 TaxID=2530380 RepID=UPI0010498E69|nr:LacI family DNA-binding transcriptional regulator [Micromonospora sp. KC721]TDB71320.1 LacI family transcriptional regulator [Micromonospora sp. KC721]